MHHQLNNKTPLIPENKFFQEVIAIVKSLQYFPYTVFQIFLLNLKIASILLFAILTSSCSKVNKKELVSFDRYTKIRLVSYTTYRREASKEDVIKLNSDSILIPNIKIVDNVVLNEENKNKILNVLCSKDYENCSLADCYQPRHILLFYKMNKIVDFYEFCCSCGDGRFSSGIKVSTICVEQGTELIKIFKEMKLKNNGEEDDDFKYF